MIKKWKKVLTDYAVKKLEKADTTILELKALNIFKSGKVKIEKSKLHPLTAELIRKMETRSSFNLCVMKNNYLGMTLNSSKPRTGENIYPVCKLLKPCEFAVGSIVRCTVHAVQPVKVATVWGASLSHVVKITKSTRAVSDTLKEVLALAGAEGTLYASSEALTELNSIKLIKGNFPKEKEVIASPSISSPENSLHEYQYTVQLLKAEGEKQIVYGVVYEPNRVDTDGDSATAGVIEDSAHQYLEDFSDINLMHEKPLGNKVVVVESFIAPCDYTCNGQTIRKGSWVMVVKIKDPVLWEAVKTKQLNAFSIEGVGLADN